MINSLDFGSRIELIQDFEFPEATNRLLLSSDGQFFIGTGVYKPQIRVWEAAQCSLKFERHTNAENVAIKTLAEDWTKLLLLQSNRQIEFHTQGGIYYSTRIPKASAIHPFCSHGMLYRFMILCMIVWP